LGGGGALLVATGIAINVDLHGIQMAGKFLEENLEAFLSGLAGRFGIGVGDNDFINDVDDVALALDEEHAHGVDVEIEGPDDLLQGVEEQGRDVDGAIEGVVDAMAVGADEFRAVFLLVRGGIEFAGGVGNFVFGDDAALGGGELKGLPVRIVVGVFETFVEVIHALGGTDEEGAAETVG
jgi:hypothetical protein